MKHHPEEENRSLASLYSKKIHYSRDELLNSKNEYNANCLTRVVVEEEVYERKKRERKKEIEELEEKKRWEIFKTAHRQRLKGRDLKRFLV